MPFYDYACEKCGTSLEIFHRIADTPRITCSKCGSLAKKAISACGIIVRNTSALRASSDRAKSEQAAHADLKENYGVEKIHPVGTQSFMEVYNGVKTQGTLLRDQMQQKREENERQAKAKRREWAVKANRRVAKRTLMAKEMRAKEDASKRAIHLVTH